MSDYDKTQWINGVTPLSQDNLNHIEDGVDSAHEEIEDLLLSQIYKIAW